MSGFCCFVYLGQHCIRLVIIFALLLEIKHFCKRNYLMGFNLPAAYCQYFSFNTMLQTTQSAESLSYCTYYSYYSNNLQLI